jgi:hypothetical protein
MGDIRCRVCGEPWEAYYVFHEMTAEERKDFLAGKHCPSCKNKPVQLHSYNYEFLQDLADNTDRDPMEILEEVEE